jgi:hypothetical protein
MSTLGEGGRFLNKSPVKRGWKKGKMKPFLIHGIIIHLQGENAHALPTSSA